MTMCREQIWELVIGHEGTNLWQLSCLRSSNIGQIHTRDELSDAKVILFIPSVNSTIAAALLCHTALLLIEASQGWCLVLLLRTHSAHHARHCLSTMCVLD